MSLCCKDIKQDFARSLKTKQKTKQLCATTIILFTQLSSQKQQHFLNVCEIAGCFDCEQVKFQTHQCCKQFKLDVSKDSGNFGKCCCSTQPPITFCSIDSISKNGTFDFAKAINCPYQKNIRHWVKPRH